MEFNLHRKHISVKEFIFTVSFCWYNGWGCLVRLSVIVAVCK